LNLTWFCGHAYTRRYFVTKCAGHGKSWDVLCLEPNTQRSYRVLFVVSERVNTASTLDDSCSFVTLTGLLISTNSLSDDFSVFSQLDDNAPRVADVDAEELLSQSHHAYTRGPGETNVHAAIEQLFVAVEKGIVIGDADFICVQLLVIVVFLKTFVVLLKHVAQFSFDKLR